MKKGFLFGLWLFLLLFNLAAVYISFTAYVYERERKILRNIGEFIQGLASKRETINISYPELTYILYTHRRTGERFVTSNVDAGIVRDMYIYTVIDLRDAVIYVYTKKISFKEYLIFVSSQPLYIGLLVAGLLLYITIFYYTVKELEVKEPVISEEVINKLKAIRLTLATFKIIPEESVEEMKKLVDSILKHTLNKR